MVKRYLVVNGDESQLCTCWADVCEEVFSYMITEKFQFICVIDIINHAIVMKIRRGD